MKQFVLAIAIAATVSGCAKSADADKPAAPTTGAATAEANASVAPAPGTITGKVLETMSSGGYTYIRIEAASGETWAAVGETDVKVGSTISVSPQMTMTDFESPTLKRTFASIVFGTLGDGAAAPRGGMPPAMAAAMGGTMGSDPHGSMGGAAPTPELANVNVAKADGPDAKSIAEIWANKDALKGKRVVVRGVVVKYSANIMGKNWMHLRDGSGSAEKRNDDITVTTTSVAAKGDTVVVTGTIATQVEIGAGYAYDVMIEDASVAK
ncbi:MAG: nucleotide-binding protein [Acidobacteria bacterium]|nr:nucleotide-binding protein [Acidobacteriota bacterium]